MSATPFSGFARQLAGGVIRGPGRLSASLAERLKRRHCVVGSGSSLTGHPADLPDVVDAPIVVEDDVWIGFNAVVLKGVRIGRCSVIGAAAVIAKDVPAYSVMVGNPARCVGTSRA